jgi:hypothetical protein
MDRVAMKSTGILLQYDRWVGTIEFMNNLTRYVKYIVLTLSVIALCIAMYQLPSYGDFKIYHAAAQLINPYEVSGFLNPPWAMLLLRPFSVLPYKLAGALWITVSLCVIMYSAYLMKADKIGVLLTVFNPFMWFFITLGQLDAFVLLGFALMTSGNKSIKPHDFLLMVIKPQVIGLAALMGIKKYSRKELVLLCGTGLLSFLVWGPWLVRMFQNWGIGLYHPIDMGIFPYGLPIGVVLLFLAWRYDSLAIAALSTYFFAPYVGPGSIIVYLAILFSVCKNNWVRIPIWLAISSYAIRLIM